jgi:hypothetical protein
MSETVRIEIFGVDWKLLRNQAELLSAMAHGDSSRDVVEKERDAIEGVLNLIAYLQQQAATFLGAQVVYGTEEPPTRAINDP